jgi:hypothetical protein
MIRLSLAAGGRPEPLDYTYADADGVAVDVSAASAVTLTWEHMSTGATGTIAGTVVDGPAGTVRATLTGAVMDTPGVVDLTFWVTVGSQLWDSQLIRLSLSDPPGSAPTI